MASDNRARPPRRGETSSRTPDVGANGHPGVWIAVGAVILGLAAVGLLRTRSQTPPERSAAETQAAGENVRPGLAENRPPVIDSLRLVPDKPDARSRIAVAAEAHDPDGDAIRYEVVWIRNGARVKALSRQVFPEGEARRGDRIWAEVVATDGAHQTSALRTPAVTVQNIPPAATEIRIAPAPLAMGEPATAAASGADPDGDVIRWRYKWVLNGQPAGDAEGSVFPGERIHPNDRLRVIATPYDSAGPGAPMESAEATVGNRPPRIVSNPPTVPEDSNLSYPVLAEDPDGDPVAFKLEGNVPEGMTISPAGLLTADLKTMHAGRYEIQITATDSHGQSDIQILTMTVPEQQAAAVPEEAPVTTKSKHKKTKTGEQPADASAKESTYSSP